MAQLLPLTPAFVLQPEATAADFRSMQSCVQMQPEIYPSEKLLSQSELNEHPCDRLFVAELHISTVNEYFQLIIVEYRGLSPVTSCD